MIENTDKVEMPLKVFNITLLIENFISHLMITNNFITD